MLTSDEQKLYDFVVSRTNGDIFQIRESLRDRLLHPSLCVLDAVYSARLRYERFDDHQRGKGLIQNYFDYVEKTRNIIIRPPRGTYLQEGQTEDTLRDLQDLFTSVGPENFGPQVMGDYGYKMPGTQILKSVGCFNLTNYLLQQDPQTRTRTGLSDYVRRVELNTKPWEAPSLKGIGEETFHYLCMLAGVDDDVKIDVHIRSLIKSVIGGGPHSREYQAQVIINVARELGVTPKALDNWLWRQARNRK